MEADREALVEVDEIGERIADSVISFFADPVNKRLVERLKESGLQMEMESKAETLSQALQGSSFVISGVFEMHSREELKALIEQHGGRNLGSISSKTDYVLAGKNMGPSKYEKAQKLGIPILSEEEFLAMLS
jgi:DNA ligase (NAD+)